MLHESQRLGGEWRPAQSPGLVRQTQVAAAQAITPQCGVRGDHARDRRIIDRG